MAWWNAFDPAKRKHPCGNAGNIHSIETRKTIASKISTIHKTTNTYENALKNLDKGQAIQRNKEWNAEERKESSKRTKKAIAEGNCSTWATRDNPNKNGGRAMKAFIAAGGSGKYWATRGIFSYKTCISGLYNSKKNNSLIRFQSSFELFRILVLEQSCIVKSYSRVPFMIKFEYENKPKRYYPDFVVVNNDNSIIIEEVKPFCFLDDPLIIAKHNAAENYCKANSLNFCVITEHDFSIGV